MVATQQQGPSRAVVLGADGLYVAQVPEPGERSLWQRFLAAVTPADKALSASQQAEVDAESAKIKANAEGPGKGPHKFKAAEWTHPNGHPRCLLCGDEQRVPVGFHPEPGSDVGSWPVADCAGAGASKALPQSGNTVGAMVAFYPELAVAQQLALEGGEAVQDLHVTLAYLGPDAAVLDRERVEAALAAFTSGVGALEGEVSGLGRFNSEDPEGWPLYASVDSAGLPAFRQRLVAALQAGGVNPVLNHGFSPHITLAYVAPEDDEAAAEILGAGVSPLPLRFDRVTLAWGRDRKDFPLTGMVKAGQLPLLKADVEAQYTFGPWYPATPEDRAGNPAAGDLDAHGEFATAEDLQRGVWDYVDHGDRSLRLQHQPGTEIGRWVELVSWPQEATFDLRLPTGEVTRKSFAPGTVYMGALWNDVGWDLVKSGRIRGYSMGGTARRINVDVGS